MEKFSLSSNPIWKQGVLDVWGSENFDVKQDTRIIISKKRVHSTRQSIFGSAWPIHFRFYCLVLFLGKVLGNQNVAKMKSKNFSSDLQTGCQISLKLLRVLWLVLKWQWSKNSRSIFAWMADKKRGDLLKNNHSKKIFC